MAARIATLRVNTPEADRAAAELAAQGVPLEKICARFDPLISPQTAKAAIARGRHALDQERPKPVLPTPQTALKPQQPAFMAAVEPPAPAPAPVAAPEPEPQAKPQPQAKQETKPKATIPLEAEELLAWAETDGTARTRTLASRTRVALAELGAIHAKHAETSEMRRFVATLEKNLAEAKAQLRRLQNATPSAAATPAIVSAGGASTSQIRAWARSNGHDVPDLGRLPAPVIDAYQAAHAA